MLKQYLCQTTKWFVLFQSAGPTEGPRPLALQRARTLKEITLHFFRCGKISITNSLPHFLPPSLCQSHLQRSWIFFSTQSSFINKIFFYSPWKKPHLSPRHNFYLLIYVSSLFSLLQVCLHLPELGQVESSNLLCFFNLLLIALHLCRMRFKHDFGYLLVKK